MYRDIKHYIFRSLYNDKRERPLINVLRNSSNFDYMYLKKESIYKASHTSNYFFTNHGCTFWFTLMAKSVWGHRQNRPPVV